MQPAARHCASRPNRAGGLRQTVRNERRTAVAWDERECRDPSARSSGNQSVPESACGPLRTVVVRVLAPRSVGRGRRYPPGAHGGAVSASLRLHCGARPPVVPHNSLRSLRSLRSNTCGKSVHEARCARGPQALALQAAPGRWPGRSPGTNSPLDCSCPGRAFSAPQRRAAACPHAPLHATLARSLRRATPSLHPPRIRSQRTTYGCQRGRRHPPGAIFRGDEERWPASTILAARRQLSWPVGARGSCG